MIINYYFIDLFSSSSTFVLFSSTTSVSVDARDGEAQSQAVTETVTEVNN